MDPGGKQPGLASLLHHLPVYVTWTECFILAVPWLPHVLTKRLMYTSYRVGVTSEAGRVCKWRGVPSRHKLAMMNAIMSCGNRGQGRSGASREAVTLKKRALRQLAAARPVTVGGREMNTSREESDQLPTPNGTGEVGSLTGICHPEAPLEFDSLHDTLWNS